MYRQTSLPKTNGEMNLPAMVQILSAGAILYNRGTSYMSIARHFFPARVHANINKKMQVTVLQYYYSNYTASRFFDGVRKRGKRFYELSFVLCSQQFSHGCVLYAASLSKGPHRSRDILVLSTLTLTALEEPTHICTLGCYCSFEKVFFPLYKSSW